MTEQRTRLMTLLEAAEWFRYHPNTVMVRLAAEAPVAFCICGTVAASIHLLGHTSSCPYDAAVRAIEAARKEKS